MREANRHVGLLLTKKCYLQCRHCYLSAGPERCETLSLKQIKAIIDHLPAQDLTSFWISGGDPFAAKQLLYDALSYLSQKDLPRLKSFSIRTSGLWGRNEKHAQRIIHELLDLNLRLPIDMATSFDEFHEECGLMLRDLVNIRRAVKSIASEGNRLYYQITLEDCGSVYPLGRAAVKVPADQWWKSPNCIFLRAQKDFFTEKGKSFNLVVHLNGDVFGCCWSRPKPLGNAIKEPIDKILERSFTDPVFRLMRQDKIEQIASDMGWSQEAIKHALEKGGKCWLCSQMFVKEQGGSV